MMRSGIFGTAVRSAAIAAALAAASAGAAQELAKPAALGVNLGGEADGSVEIIDVRPGLTAAAIGVKPGDVVVRIGDAPVSSPDDVLDYVGKLKAGDRVDLTVRRGTAELRLTGEATARPDGYQTGIIEKAEAN